MTRTDRARLPRLVATSVVLPLAEATRVVSLPEFPDDDGARWDDGATGIDVPTASIVGRSGVWTFSSSPVGSPPKSQRRSPMAAVSMLAE